MNQRTILMTAAALTAFVLLIAGALAGRLSQSAAPPASTPLAAEAAPAPQAPAATLSAEREAAYQTALAEANQRLEQANQQLATAQNVAVMPPQAASQAAPASAETAAAIAQTYRGGGVVRKVELEQERGLTVYEVKFTDGGEVYVDAATGQVVYAKLTGTDDRDHDQDN